MKLIKSVFNFIKENLGGYKTIAVGLAMIILGYHNSDNQMMLEGLGLICLRLGLKKLE